MNLNIAKVSHLKSARVIDNFSSGWLAEPEEVLEGALWLEVLAKNLANLYLATIQETPDALGRLRANLSHDDRLFATKWVLRLQQMTVAEEGSALAGRFRPELSRVLAFERLMTCAETVLALEKAFMEQGLENQIAEAHSAAFVSVWEGKAESICAQYNYCIAPKSAGRLPPLDFEHLKAREAHQQFGRQFDELSAYEKVKVYGAVAQVAEAQLNQICP